MFLILHKSVPSQTQQNKFVNWQGDAEIRGEDFTATVTLGNPDVLVGSGRSSVSDAAYIESGDMFTFWHPETKITSLSSMFYECLKFSDGMFNLTKTKMLFWSWTPLVVHLSGIVVTHYLQSITPDLALGGELVYHRRPGEEGAVMSLVGRYTGETQVTSNMLSGSSFLGISVSIMFVFFNLVDQYWPHLLQYR